MGACSGELAWCGSLDGSPSALRSCRRAGRRELARLQAKGQVHSLDFQFLEAVVQALQLRILVQLQLAVAAGEILVAALSAVAALVLREDLVLRECMMAVVMAHRQLLPALLHSRRASLVPSLALGTASALRLLLPLHHPLQRLKQTARVTRQLPSVQLHRRAQLRQSDWRSSRRLRSPRLLHLRPLLALTIVHLCCMWQALRVARQTLAASLMMRPSQ